jgi:hypothetical protein
MIFKKGDRVTTPYGAGIVFDDQQANEVKVLITATDAVATFTAEDIDYEVSSADSREGLDS